MSQGYFSQSEISQDRHKKAKAGEDRIKNLVKSRVKTMGSPFQSPLVHENDFLTAGNSGLE